MRRGVVIAAFSLIFAAFAASAAQAQFDDDDWRAHDRVDSGQVQPLDRILPEIRRNHPGRFYDAVGPFLGPDGQMHYRLKWMTPDGRVIWFDANARTGRVLGTGAGRFGGPGYGYGGDEQQSRERDWRGEDRNWQGGDRNWQGGGERDWQGGGRGWQGGHGWQGGQGGHGNWGGGGRFNGHDHGNGHGHGD